MQAGVSSCCHTFGRLVLAQDILSVRNKAQGETAISSETGLHTRCGASAQSFSIRPAVSRTTPYQNVSRHGFRYASVCIAAAAIIFSSCRSFARSPHSSAAWCGAAYGIISLQFAVCLQTRCVHTPQPEKVRHSEKRAVTPCCEHDSHPHVFCCNKRQKL